MKKILVAVAFVLVLTTPSLACDTSGWCGTMQQYLYPGQCCHNIYWTDLGSFDSNGQFVWTYKYENQLFAQFDDSTKAQFTPYKTSATVPISKRMLYANIQDFGTTKETRVNFELPSEIIYWPEFAELTFPDPQYPPPVNPPVPEVSFGANFIGAPWTQPHMLSEQQPPYSFNQIESICWEEQQNKCADHRAEVNSTRWNLAYNVNSDSNNLGKINFWTVPQGQSFEVVVNKEVYAFFDNVIPVSGASNTIKVQFTTGPEITLKFMAMDYSDSEFPPIIPLYVKKEFVTPTGRGIKSVTSTIQNITSYEKDGNLIIQWPESAILEPYVEMFVYISDGADLRNDPSPVNQAFLWVDSPSQLGTVVIPADRWSTVKTSLKNRGKTEASCSIHYRYRWTPPPIEQEIAQSAIRSRSQSFMIPLQ